ncbi:MAG: OmpA family protein, partial [Chitinophagaceae bacterium]|nr:OmpA family protein [Chitinophagaceae bacterium]
AELQTRLQESEARSREQATVNELPAKQAVAPAPTLNLPVWTPGAGGKNNSNLVVLPVGAGGGKKNRDQEELSQEQRRLAKRQDSILHQLSRVQAKLAALQMPQTDSVAQTGDTLQRSDSLALAAPDTLVKLPAVKPYADSVQQALQRQIRQLNKENEALQQMVGTISGLAPKEEQGGAGQSQLAAYDVFFNVNQSRPDTLALRQLLAFADTLRSSGAYWILLEGFTDKSGNAAYNLQLSKKRVASVKAVLVEQGIPKESILEKTFGSRFSTGLTNSNDRKVRITQILR